MFSSVFITHKTILRPTSPLERELEPGTVIELTTAESKKLIESGCAVHVQVDVNGNIIGETPTIPRKSRVKALGAAPLNKSKKNEPVSAWIND